MIIASLRREIREKIKGKKIRNILIKKEEFRGV
jgi:hypothetical protein